MEEATGQGGGTAEEKATPRLTGEAAWKAQRQALDERNAAAKKRAHEQPSPAVVAANERERRLDIQEEAQLRALNARLDQPH